MMYGYEYGPSFGLFHLISWIFWIALIVFIIKLVRRNNHGSAGRFLGMSMGDKGMDILKERFAKGEITKEDYEERKKVLMQ